MARFAYAAVDAHGTAVRGVEDAATLSAARTALAERDLRVSTITARTSRFNVEITASRLKAGDLMHLSRQLSAFLRAGIPILDAIGVLADESDRPAVRKVLETIGEDLRAGTTLSEAIDRHPKDFPAWYRGILHSAELTGRLDEVLEQLAGYIERDEQARREVRSAMIYPGIVAAMAVGTIVILSVFVLPRFEDFFAGLDAKLPWPTRALLSSTRFLGRWWWLILSVFGVLLLTVLLVLRTRAGRLVVDRVLLRVPVIGETIRYSMIERFARLMASMVQAGVPLPQAMAVATSALGNQVFVLELGRARTQLMQGAGLSGPLTATGLLPGVASQMIRVGEETGTLDDQLSVVAEFYARELGYKIKKLTTVIEPVVIVIMGGIVGFVCVALVSAMYGIFRSVNLS